TPIADDRTPHLPGGRPYTIELVRATETRPEGSGSPAPTRRRLPGNIWECFPSASDRGRPVHRRDNPLARLVRVHLARHPLITAKRRASQPHHASARRPNANSPTLTPSSMTTQPLSICKIHDVQPRLP